MGIGDMPVIARSKNADGSLGTPCCMIFTNVRCVPKFSYTLLSVNQLWDEQRIHAVFADQRHLKLPNSADNINIPYDPLGGTKANQVTLVSVARMSPKGRPPISGFYTPKTDDPANKTAASTPNTEIAGDPIPAIPPNPALRGSVQPAGGGSGVHTHT